MNKIKHNITILVMLKTGLEKSQFIKYQNTIVCSLSQHDTFVCSPDTWYKIWNAFCVHSPHISVIPSGHLYEKWNPIRMLSLDCRVKMVEHVTDEYTSILTRWMRTMSRIIQTRLLCYYIRNLLSHSVKSLNIEANNALIKFLASAQQKKKTGRYETYEKSYLVGL